MRTITIEKKLYKFSELSEESKNQVIETQIQAENDVMKEYFTDIISESLDEWYKRTGIEIDVSDVWYSVTYCQGDGVSFITDSIDIEKALEFFGKQSPKHADYVEKIKNDRNYKAVKLDYEFTIYRTSYQYCHENTVDCDYTDTSCECADGQWQLAEKIRKVINEVKNTICGTIYDELIKEHRYRTSEEYITELLESENNEYTSDGAIY